MSFVAILALLALFALVIIFGIMFKWKGWKTALITTGGRAYCFHRDDCGSSCGDYQFDGQLSGSSKNCYTIS